MIIQGSAHTGRQWFKVTSTLLNPTSTILTYITDTCAIYPNITHSISVMLTLGHHSGISGQNPDHIVYVVEL